MRFLQRKRVIHRPTEIHTHTHTISHTDTGVTPPSQLGWFLKLRPLSSGLRLFSMRLHHNWCLLLLCQLFGRHSLPFLLLNHPSHVLCLLVCLGLQRRENALLTTYYTHRSLLTTDNILHTQISADNILHTQISTDNILHTQISTDTNTYTHRLY